MEFTCTAEGEIRYEGLSLFHTANGAYIGNILATENAKLETISRYISIDLINVIKEKICHLLSPILTGRYEGPFGVDMMITEGGLHPCVEINLRLTMGHVALSIPCDETMPQRLMRIDYTNRYHLRIIDTNENVLNGLML